MDLQAFAEAANYPSVWLTRGLLDGPFFQEQENEFHRSLRLFHPLASLKPDEQKTMDLFAAAVADPDAPMAGSVIKDLLGKPFATEAMLSQALKVVAANQLTSLRDAAQLARQAIMKALSGSFVLLLLICLFACRPADPAATPDWDQAHVAKLHLQLVDPERVQYILFDPNGTAAGGFGDSLGVAPIIVYWRISQGRLVLSTNDTPIDELTLISESDEYIVARSKSGKTLKYRKIGR